MKITILALCLATAPGLAMAMGCSSGHDKVTMSCADGGTWDDAQQACVPLVSS